MGSTGRHFSSRRFARCSDWFRPQPRWLLPVSESIRRLPLEPAPRDDHSPRRWEPVTRKILVRGAAREPD